VAPPDTLANLIPKPLSATSGSGAFALSSASDVYVNPGTSELIGIGQYLTSKLNPSTGFGMQAVSTTAAPGAGNIYLTIGTDSTLGDEGYQLTITPSLVTLTAWKPAGLFRGVQTIRQLLKAEIERTTVQSGPWAMPAATIRDVPRFAYRGAMLDVARHFFSVADVKAYIDQMAYYKLNRFHLHLTDDQGWRIYINSWPQLAIHGGSTQVGGGAGGYYTQAQYTDLVSYAQARYITVIPEIDMPGHTNAAQASYANLNCNGVAPALYTGTAVGFSSLCIRNEITYTFINDVIRELAAITPGTYIHVGGDEASNTTAADYVYFFDRVKALVQGNGKQMMGWEDIGSTNIPPSTIAQHWNSASMAQTAASKGATVVMSPATKAYLDMKYDASTPLGLSWAGFTDVQDAYTWDPATLGVSAGSVLGPEAPLWTETIRTLDEIEYMAFPRLAGHAEIGWSPSTGRSWSEYSVRLGSHGPRLTNMGVNFFRSAQVPWR
jgi:hexosaminidase